MSGLSLRCDWLGAMAATKEERPEEDREMPGVTMPEEGGWGWMIVAGCFLAMMCIRAVTRSVREVTMWSKSYESLRV